jgi:copper chaperone
MSKTSLVIDIDGMSCGHCIKAVREALEEVEGVAVREVVIGRAVVDIDDAADLKERVASAVDETGYIVRAIA